MKFKFNFLLNTYDLFWSSIYYSYYSYKGFFSILFSLFFLIFLIIALYFGYYDDFNTIYKILIVISSMLFTIIQPIMLFLKVFNKTRHIPYKNVEFKFYDDEFSIKYDNEESIFKYDVIYKIKKYKKMIVVFYDVINGQIFPNRIFDNNKEDFYKFLLEKIK